MPGVFTPPANDWEVKQNSPDAGGKEESGHSRGSLVGLGKSFSKRLGEAGFELSGESELEALEREYQLAANQLFGNSAFPILREPENPFDAAKPAPASRDKKQSSESANSPQTTVAENPPAESGGAVEKLNPTQDIEPTQPLRENPDVFDFLVIGNWAQLSGRVFRAARLETGSFALEGGLEFSFVMGISRKILVFGDNDQVLTSDLNGDGLTDLVFARVGPLGTVLDSYLGDEYGEFRRWAFGFVLQKSVIGLALYDFNADGQLDLALLVKNSPHLFVYEKSGEQFKYVKELLLPFTPGLVVDSDSGGSQKDRRLYVLDSALRNGVTIGSRYSDSFVVGTDDLLNSARILKLTNLGGQTGEADVLVFEYGNRIVLAESRPGGPLFYGSLSTAGKVPFVIIGDFQGYKSRQLVYIP
ncbi:MAG: VCBS repeat-containing protein [Acidobacteria bacterium]|nr:VCBS repeat-containing protein [Acidobacteriota bacterium]